MATKETLRGQEEFDYEILESILAKYKADGVDKEAIDQESRAFFEARIGQSMTITGDAMHFITPDGQLGNYDDGAYQMTDRSVVIVSAVVEGVVVSKYKAVQGMPNDQPIILYSTIDPVPNSGDMT